MEREPEVKITPIIELKKASSDDSDKLRRWACSICSANRSNCEGGCPIREEVDLGKDGDTLLPDSE
ncbi:MAG: hypothetical protein PWQ10_296 [Patescibacteria group bacterium]|nr:hypothetical protein [Patescibacteria group bacterium]